MPDKDEEEAASAPKNDDEPGEEAEDDEDEFGGDNDDDDEDEEPEEEEEEEVTGGPLLSGSDIARALKSTGPVVIKCVLLKHLRSDGKDGKPHPASPRPNPDGVHQRVVLVEDIEEVDVDVTPEKTQIQELLGGPFTFLGQYEEEGTVVIARQDLPDDLAELSVHQLRELARDHYLDTSTVLEKSDLVDALWATQLPYNPHHLQPPLDKVRVRGDILLMRVAKTDEALDDDEDEDDDGDKGKKKVAKKIHVLPNDEFFLDYSKDEYVQFASRTDVHAPEPPEGDDEDDDAEDDDDEEDDDEDYDPAMEDEEEKLAMLNLVMGEVLRKFREEHGRGPDTRELLEIRGHVAAQLDVEVATVEALEESAASANAKKRKKKGKGEGGGAAGEGDDEGGDDDDDDEGKPSKHVKFQASLKREEDDSDNEDDGEARAKDDNVKPPATEGNGDISAPSD